MYTVIYILLLIFVLYIEFCICIVFIMNLTKIEGIKITETNITRKNIPYIYILLILNISFLYPDIYPWILLYFLYNILFPYYTL